MLRVPLIRNVQRRLRLIEYHSATRPRDGWTRAMDVSLVLTLVLSLPASWLCDALVTRSVRVAEISGILSQHEDGTVTAALNDSDIKPAARSQPTAPGVPIGTFQLVLIDHHSGWPVTTTIRQQPVRVDLDLRIEPAPRPKAMLAPDDPLRIAISERLKLEGRNDLLSAWPAPDQMPSGRAGIGVNRHWFGWITASAIWWIILVFAIGAIIHALKFTTIIMFAKRHARRAQLRAQGKCHTCGYDMTGLDFNERCPECGELVW